MANKKTYIKAGDAGPYKAVTIDECPDANGNWTMRFANGTANGDTTQEPIATFYQLDVAESVARACNALGVISALYGVN